MHVVVSLHRQVDLVLGEQPSSADRTPPPELCPLQVEKAHSWKKATMKSMFGLIRQDAPGLRG